MLAVGRQLRQSREARGLSLRQLALQTRISTAVLEALERGWRDRLPEAAYLRTMLPLLEAELDLPTGSLATAIPAERIAARGQRPQRRLRLGSIELFTSWQGAALGVGLTLGLVYALNLEQQRLASQGRLALQPIPPLPAAEQQRPQAPGAALLQAYPELRPLELAARGQGLLLLRREASGGEPRQGVLELALTGATRLSLQSEAGLSTELEGVRGELRLPLSAPFRLRLDPAPGAARAVLWNGSPLAPLPGRPGQYAVPAPRPAAAANRP